MYMLFLHIAYNQCEGIDALIITGEALIISGPSRLPGKQKKSQ